MGDVTRRTFMKTAAAGAAVGLTLGTSKTSWAGANETIRVAVLGIRGRGRSHLGGFIGRDKVQVVALADPDSRLFEPRMKEFFDDKGVERPRCEQDLRRIMDDPSIDAVSIATPNHWHALASIWACQAGKHVYVEKPCSHNVFEGRKLVEAAKKYNRVVSHGTQIRSNPGIIEAIQKLNEGVIGEVYMARGLCYKSRDTIGHTPDAPVPEGVDYNLWLGPAPERPFSENRFHYNWHWHWDYGNGDIGNQGVHQMDVARWGLGVGMPSKVSAMGDMFLFDDDKEVPNTITSAFHYPDAGPKGKMMVFEVRPWHTNDEAGVKIGNLFYGSEGYMVIDSYSRYKTFLAGGEPGPSRDEGGDHYGNFIDAVRAEDPSMVTADAEEGHLSSALCHLGLISTKLGRSFDFDPATETIPGDEEANAMLTRNYRGPFTVPEKV